MEKVLGKRVLDGCVEYLLKWKGYPEYVFVLNYGLFYLWFCHTVDLWFANKVCSVNVPLIQNSYIESNFSIGNTENSNDPFHDFFFPKQASYDSFQR